MLYRVVAALARRLFPPTPEPTRMLQRMVLNREIDQWIESADPSRLTAAEISGTTHAGRGWAGYEVLMYPEFDLCAPLDGQGEFDVVICEQVLEHVLDPVAAAANLCRLCRPGGTVIVSTPFLIRVHELPDWGMFDYWRFTPRGMRVLLENAGLEVLQVSSWGNRETVVTEMNQWTEYKRWHPVRNEPDLPVQVWAFARRPVE